MNDKIKFHKPVTSSLRHRVSLTRYQEDAQKNERGSRRLLVMLKKSSGRSLGKATVRHKGGAAKKFYRLVDFKRTKVDVVGKVVAIEHDPNRNVNLARVNYTNGEKVYILCPEGLAIGASVQSGENSPIEPGNTLPLDKIPVGTFIHNLEINLGAGGVLVRGAGTAAQVLAKEEDGLNVQVKLPSGEVRRIFARCAATIGQLGNFQYRNIKFGKAGRKRHMGIKPVVRGIAQDPRSHPHGGGEGRSGIGMPSPKTPWGKNAMGHRTRRRGRTDKYIIERRNK